METKNIPHPLNFKKKYWYICKQCRHSGYTDNVNGTCSKCHKKFTTSKTKINFNPHYVGLMTPKHEVKPVKETLVEETKVLEKDLKPVVKEPESKQKEVVENERTEYLGQPTPLTQHEIDLGFVETHTIREEGEVIDTDNELVSTVEDDDTDEARKIRPADDEKEQLSRAREKEVREQLKVLEQIRRYNAREWASVTRWGIAYLCLLVLVFIMVLYIFFTEVIH